VPYEIAGIQFRTKAFIKKHFQSVRDDADKGETITDPVVCALLQAHSDWPEKAKDMARLTKDWIKGAPTVAPSLQVVIENNDGSIMDISYLHALKCLQKDGSVKVVDDSLSEFKKAARQEIDYLMSKYRVKGQHVDHTFPLTFEVLLADFCHDYRINPRKVAVDANTGQVVKRSFADRALAENWKKYHEQHADLRVVSAEENLSAPKARVDWAVLDNF
jgi:sulfur carrier protein ThiS